MLNISYMSVISDAVI